MPAPVDLTNDELLVLLVRARNSIVLHLRREAWDKPVTPTPVLLAIDEALHITDHSEYIDRFADDRLIRAQEMDAL
jgi:hypothetical protein